MSNATPITPKKKKSLASRLFRSSGSKKNQSSEKLAEFDASSQKVPDENDEEPDEYDGFFEKVATPSRIQSASIARERSAPDDEWEEFGRRSRSKNAEEPRHRSLVGSTSTSTAPSTISMRDMKQRQAQQQYDRLIPIPSENSGNSKATSKSKDSFGQKNYRGTPSKKQHHQVFSNNVSTSASSTPASLTRVALTRPFGRACLPPFAKVKYEYLNAINQNKILTNNLCC